MGTGEAADLASELAIWGPVATGHRDAREGVWFADAVATATTRTRLESLSMVARDGEPVDGQVCVGRLWDQTAGSEFGMNCTWTRLYARAGTDSLAASAGRAFAMAGVSIHLPAFISVQSEFGRSQERGLIADGEACLLFVRVRLEHDDQTDTVRVGTGPRILGTTAPWAWGVLVDWASTRVETETGFHRSTEGAIGQGFLIYRLANRWLIGASVTSVTDAIDRQNPQANTSGQIEAAMTLGVVF
jgi:hypothetical protein